MNREVHVRFWESPEVKVLRATRQNEPSHSFRRRGRSTSISGPTGPAFGASESGHGTKPLAR